MASLMMTVKAETAAEVLGQITGMRPVVKYDPQGAILYWTPQQQAALRVEFNRRLDEQLRGRITPPPEQIRVEWAPIVLPVVARKVTPYAGGVAALLAGVGYLLGRRR